MLRQTGECRARPCASRRTELYARARTKPRQRKSASGFRPCDDDPSRKRDRADRRRRWGLAEKIFVIQWFGRPTAIGRKIGEFLAKFSLLCYIFNMFLILKIGNPEVRHGIY